ncbi:MAG TPA: transporter [Candidatus Binatia bacterium]|nr:transporter [Candidatus Binatia bacterium]
MRDVAIIGLGMHPWGKFEDRSVTGMMRIATEAALKDAGVAWREIQAVCSASSRFSGGRGWGLNGNDIVEEMGSTGIPVYNLSAGCAAGANAFNVGYSLVAGGMFDAILVVGGEKMPKGFIQTSGVQEETDPEYLRQACVGMPGPAFWAVMCRRRMAEFGTTEEQLAKIAVKARKNGVHNPWARFRKEVTVEDILKSNLVSYPLRLFEICPVSDGASAVVICSAEFARKRTIKPVWVASSAVATAKFDDGIPRGLAGATPPGNTYHSEAASAVKKAMESAGVSHKDVDFIELQDNTVYYELSFPEDWGFCGPGEAESLLESGETAPNGKLPINPSGGFLSFGEATTAQGIFQVCELVTQLRGEGGGRQVPDAKVGLGQTLGLGGNGAAVILKR